MTNRFLILIGKPSLLIPFQRGNSISLRLKTKVTERPALSPPRRKVSRSADLCFTTSFTFVLFQQDFTDT